MNTERFCPVHHTQFEWLSTDNAWRNYCRQCDKRYDDNLEEMPAYERRLPDGTIQLGADLEHIVEKISEGR